jgi:hypothetical protein
VNFKDRGSDVPQNVRLKPGECKTKGGGNQDKVLKGTELLAQEREEGSTRGKRKWKAGASEATPISLPRGPVAQET